MNHDRCVRWLGAGVVALAVLAGGASPARAALPTGHYCVVGLGPTTAGATDGWVATVSPTGVVTNRTPANLLVNPWDCAIDPTTGDVIVVDEGNTGAGTNGAVYRLAINGASTTVTTIVSGAPLVNPRGVAVGQDGTIYVADTGANFNTNDNDGRIFAISFSGGVPTVNSLTAAGNNSVDSPVDLDIDPRPFNGVINVVYLERTGQIRRVPITLPGPNTPADVSGDPAGSAWEGIEVGPYGQYFLVDDSTPSVQRYDRISNTLTSLVTLAGTSTPRGITVNYNTADLVIADSDAAATGGVVNVPPNINLAGAPARTVLVAPGALPGTNAAGVGWSPPLASTSPSANFGVPTRRAPIPGEAFGLIGPTYAVAGGEIERELNLFIEVTDTSSPLMIRIFDPNLRDGYDVNLTGAYDTPTRYTVYDPSGAVLTQVTIAANGSVDLDQRIATLNTGNTLTVGGAGIALAANRQGLYRLQIELTASDDWNGFGVWVDRFQSYTYSFATGVSVTTGGPPNLIPLDDFRTYPYFDRGCEHTVSVFDGDNVAGTGYVESSRLAQSFTITNSGNSVHAETTVDPTPTGAAARSSIETDYGLYTFEGTTVPNLNEFNVITFKTPDFQGWDDAGGTGVPVPVPKGNATVNPTPSMRTSPGPAFPQVLGANSNNFLRHYLPRYDESPTTAAAPYAPYAMHSATPLAGNPPAVGVPAFYGILVTVVNPDPVDAMSNVSLTAVVPAGAFYVTSGTNVNGPAQASGGGSVTTCAAPCAGNITATWATIPAASAVTLAYAVRVTAASAGQQMLLTGGPSVRGGGSAPGANPGVTAAGTAATFRPAWSSATFTRSESLGPLCELAVTQGTTTPVAVALSRFDATAGDGEVLVAWDTASEFRNLGFHVWRRLDGEDDYRRVTPGLVLGRGTTDLAAHYAFRDTALENGRGAEYVIEDVEIDGRSTWHGPVSATPLAGLVDPAFDAAELALSVPAPPAATTPLLAAGAGAGSSGGSTLASGSGGGSGAASGTGSAGSTAGGDTGSLQVLSQDANGAVVEIRVPPVQTTPLTLDGVVWTDVSASAYGVTLAPGWPQLPTQTFWVELPDRARFDATVLERDGQEVTLASPVRPVASGSATTADAGAYASSTPYPAAEVEIAGSVPSGDRRLVALRVSPARWVASGSRLEVASRLVVRLDAAGPTALAANASTDQLTANLRALAASPGIWIGVTGRGLVRVGAEALLAAGLSPSVDPRTLQLYRLGVEQAIRVDGEADGRLDVGDALVFWAEGLDTRYSGEESFFLLPADTPGRRAADVVTAPSGAPVVNAVPAHGHFEEQTRYLPGILNGEGDNYVGAYVYASPVASAVPTPGAAAGPATLRVRLRGGTTYADLPSDHHFGVRVAGVDVMDVRFDGSDAFDGSVALPPGLVADGQTVVEVVPRFDSGAPFDLVYVDALDLDYVREPSLRGADGGRLELAPGASGPVAVGGIASPAVRVWDVTDAASPGVVPATWIPSGHAVFEAVAGRHYAVSADAALLPASRIAVNAPSQWTSGGGADWVAIAPSSLLPSLQPLAARREAQGLRTALIDVQDVYDEASGGDFTPVAIREFLRALTTSWSPAPRFVLLVGDATYDYRDHLHGAAHDLVPTMLVDTEFAEAASDSWFGAFSQGSPAPALAIGRLPVRDAAELDAVVAKIVAYETAAAAPGADADAWRARILTVADDGLGAGSPLEGAAFDGIVDGFAASASPDFARSRIALSELPDANVSAVANAAIVGALQDGAAVAVYAGHGGARVWADELVFGTGDVAAIANGAKLPLFLVLDCLNAFFDAPNEESLGEVALRSPDRGAIAYVSSTTVSALGGQDAFARALSERLLRANVRAAGEALMAAQQAVAADPGAADVVRTFVLLGDPATRLGLPVVPIANAGPDATVGVMQALQLDGTASTSPRGGTLSFAWRVVAEPESGAATLLEGASARPWFWGRVPGSYELELVVGDGRFRGAPDRVRIDVNVPPVGPTCAPTGPPQQVSGLDFLYLVAPLLLTRVGRRRR